MKIGIIGAGFIGGTLAKKLVDLGHHVVIANSRGPETLREVAAETGATPVTANEAARGGEIVIVTITQRAIPDLRKDLFAGVPADVVVVDTGNYYPSRDGELPKFDEAQPESAWVGEHLGRPVVKAFNNIFYKSLQAKSAPKGAAGRVALPIAAGSPEARAKVMRLVDELGFDPIDAGNLEESWRQQPGTPCYIQDFDAPKLRAALASAEKSRIPQYRREADEAMKAYFEALKKA